MDPKHYLANYDIENEIGQGSFATVFLGHEKVILYFLIGLLYFPFQLDHKSKSCHKGCKYGKVK